MNSRTLHFFLGVDKANPLFEVLFDPEVPDELLVHFGMMLLETVPRNSFQEKLLIARLFNAGFNQRRLHETFHYAIKTMRRWGKLLKKGDSESIRSIGEGQGAKKKITDDRLRFIHYLFDKHHKEKGCHIISHITEAYADTYHDTVSNETIRQIISQKKSATCETCHETNVLEYPPVSYSDAVKIEKRMNDLFTAIYCNSSVPKSVKRENTCNNREFPRSNAEKNSNLSPYGYDISTDTDSSDIKSDNDGIQNDIGEDFPMVKSFSSQLLSCHHIGILLSRILIDFISCDMNGIADIVRQWLGMILLGYNNIEQGRALNYRVFELFIGRQIRSPAKQRGKLKYIASMSNVLQLFKRNIRMIGAGLDNTFMLDPHGVAYTGQLRTLKCWLGSSHSVGKGYYLDLIHTLRGEPVFSLIDDNFYDLRERFISVIAEFRKILEGDQDRFLTLVIDRAIYDVEYMKKMHLQKIHIITWEKNYKAGIWKSEADNYPVQVFTIMKYRNSKEDSYIYTVRFFKRRWIKEESFAQFTILLSKPGKDSIELSVICTDYDRESEESIKPILTRWLQENDIGYLVTLGINQITSYTYHPYSQIIETLNDRVMENSEFKKLRAEKLDLKKKLGLLLVERESYIERKEHENITLTESLKQLENEADNCDMTDENRTELKREIRRVNSKIKRISRNKETVLKRNIKKQKALRERIKELEDKLGDTPREISRIDKIIQEEYVKLNFMPKLFMDAIKITARNIIYQLLEIFRPIWNNYRNDLVILRELITATGHIRETQSSIYIEINPARQFGKKEKRKIEMFFFEISGRVNKTYKSDKVIIFSLYEF